MAIGNVLVIGNSGVGKSTLINAVIGEERAETGWGIKGTTSKLAIYESPAIPLRLIDTVGFEPSARGQKNAINAVRSWSKAKTKEDLEEKQINVIWFCVDGMAGKLFSDTLSNLAQATSMWSSIPVIVVITKSFSVPERQRNIEMVINAFAMQTRYATNLRKIIPVVAQELLINDSAFAPPEGIAELIDATNELMPDGIKAAKEVVSSYLLQRKRLLSHGLVSTAAPAAAAIGAIPIPLADAAPLTLLEVGMINALAGIYGINKMEGSKAFLDSIIKAGTVSAAAKQSISLLKSIPGLNLGTSILNAAIAAGFVIALGEGSIYAFEQVYIGKQSIEDIEWLTKLLENKLSSQLVEALTEMVDKIVPGTDFKTLAAMIADAFRRKQ